MGVLLRSILIFFPNPEAALFATAFRKFPLSFFPIEYSVLASAPLTFLISKLSSSSWLNSKTFISSAKTEKLRTSNKKIS